MPKGKHRGGQEWEKLEKVQEGTAGANYNPSTETLHRGVGTAWGSPISVGRGTRHGSHEEQTEPVGAVHTPPSHHEGRILRGGRGEGRRRFRRQSTGWEGEVTGAESSQGRQRASREAGSGSPGISERPGAGGGGTRLTAQCWGQALWGKQPRLPLLVTTQAVKAPPWQISVSHVSSVNAELGRDANHQPSHPHPAAGHSQLLKAPVWALEVLAC